MSLPPFYSQSRILLAYTPKTKLFWRKTMKMPYYGINPLNYEQELKRYKLSAFSNMYLTRKKLLLCYKAYSISERKLLQQFSCHTT